MALTQISTGGIKDDSIVNADIKSDAAIALSKLASTPAVLTGSTNNQITTVTAANAIQGEANLTFDGTNLGINQSNPTDLLEIHPTENNKGITLKDAHQVYPAITFDVNRSGADQYLGNIRGTWNGTIVSNILFETGQDTTNKDDGVITFRTAAAGSPAERFRIESGGNVKINNGDLVIGTSGHGIDFSATADGTGSNQNELLSDYEQGTWTPVYQSSGGTISGISYNAQVGRYVKIGNLVYIEGKLQTSAITVDTSGTYDIGGLPFTSNSAASLGGIKCYLQQSWVNAPDTFDVSASTNTMRARQGIDVGDGTYTTGQTADFNVNVGSKNRVLFNGHYRV